MDGSHNGSKSNLKRRRQVVVLRNRGLTFRQIAERQGVTPQRIQQLYSALVRPEDDPLRKPRLTEAIILKWAEAHYERTRRWPSVESGEVVDAPGETWIAINGALRRGVRGLPGGSSIHLLLANQRKERPSQYPISLTEEMILAWADAHHARTGQWPGHYSGTVVHGNGETWQGINEALSRGRRGLSGGSTLYRLLREHRNIPERRAGRPRKIAT